jgi:hypothetical protein
MGMDLLQLSTWTFEDINDVAGGEIGRDRELALASIPCHSRFASADHHSVTSALRSEATATTEPTAAISSSTKKSHKTVKRGGKIHPALLAGFAASKTRRRQPGPKPN